MHGPGSINHNSMKCLSLKTKHLCMGLVAAALLTGVGCRREIGSLQSLTLPAKGEVFIDDFTSDLAYAAFGGSDVKAFQVDTRETYNNTRASMRFEVPDEGSPQGGYAGGVFFSRSGRNLSGFDALTFYIKATQPVNIGVIGFGNDLGDSKYLVTVNGLAANTNWRKVIIPIPDASKLAAEKGLMYYSAGPVNGRGYTFWIDEVKFEKLGTITTPVGRIFGGQERVISNAENGDKIRIDGIQAVANMPNGVNQVVDVSPHYLTYVSSAPAVASVSAVGEVTVLSAGTTNITATLGGRPATGILRLTSIGQPILPAGPAPTPTRDAANVISMFSNAYTNRPIDTWNSRWEFSTADESYLKIAGDDVIRYKNLNFVGIEFSSNTINATAMTGFHMDVWTPDNTNPPNNFKVLLVDFGPDNNFGGGDDKSHEITITRPTLVSNNWFSIDVPLSAFSGLTTRGNLAQMVLSGTLPNVFIDNVYFYRQATNPSGPAPTPTYPAANVISIFSDAYTNVPGSDLNPNWGQATIVTQVPINGNNTLLYTGLNYQGLQLGSAQNVSGMTFLHLDYFSANATTLKVFLISPGPVETPYNLTVPTTGGWQSVDIPLTAFAPVALNNVFQLKFEGNGNVYLDNILFRR